MADDSLLSELDDLEVVHLAEQHVAATDGYQNALRDRYDTLHFYYQPPDGDQWPQDRDKRPNQLHITANICKPAVNIDSRLQAKLPRLALNPKSIKPADRDRAAKVEQIMRDTLDLSGWDVWLGDLTKSKCLYGKGVLKPFWNVEEKRPDVSVVETPGNLRIGWGSSDFSTIDWALYEYSLSPVEVLRRFSNLEVLPPQQAGNIAQVQYRASSKEDILGMKADDTGRPDDYNAYTPSDYERQQLRVWDYWFRDEEGVVRNAIIVEKHLAKPKGQSVLVAKHPELLDIPYIVIENIHEPGTPEGLSTIEDLVDIQHNYNVALTHWAQLVNDEIDPAWQHTGESQLPDGVVPSAGEIVEAGDGEIKPIAKPVNVFPIAELVKELWNAYHKTSGLPEILFTVPPGAQTAGRALSIMVEAAMNQMEPKRNRLYQGLAQLLIFWTYMLERKQPKELGSVVKGFRRWRFVAPEITPRDMIEATQNAANKVNGHLSSIVHAMDEIGVDNPEDELELIRQEQTDISLNPGNVQVIAAVVAQVVTMMAQNPQIGSALGNLIPMGNNLQGQGAQMLAEQGRQPAGFEDQNQPMSQPGMPPQAGGAPPTQAGAPAMQGQTLIRPQPNGGAIALNQTRLPYPGMASAGAL